MGYRSDVLFVLEKSDELAEQINRYELWISGEGAGSVKKRLDEIFDEKTEEGEWFEWFQGSVKWYSNAGFPDVDWLETLMNWLDSQGLEEHYQFLRVGDNLDDNDDRGWCRIYRITKSIQRQ